MRFEAPFLGEILIHGFTSSTPLIGFKRGLTG
jgi:hypothetical protein